MSFPLNPVNGQQAIVNGIKYNYTAATRSWRRDFSNVLDRLFLVGNNQATVGNTSTGDLVVVGGGRIGRDLILGGDLYVGGIVKGLVTTATNASTIIGGAAGSLVYQSSTGTTSFIGIASTGSILMSNGVIPVWTASAAITVSQATSATNIIGGGQWQIPFQSSTGTTTFSSNLTFNRSTLSISTNTQSISTTSGALVVAGGVGIQGDVFIGGNLQILGTSTVVNSQTLDVADVNITVAKGAINAAAADGAGLTVEGPTTQPRIYYAVSDNSWNANLVFNLNSATITATTQAVSTASGALQVRGGIGVGGTVFAAGLSGPHNGTVGAITPASGVFTTLAVRTGVTSTSTGTGSLVVQGGAGIAGDLYVGGVINGTITYATSSSYATSATTAVSATSAGSATTAVTAQSATTATNLAGGSAGTIAFQSAANVTSFNNNFTFDGTTIKNYIANSNILSQYAIGLDLKNTSVNQSPVIRLAGSSSGIALLSSFGVLKIMQDANSLTNALMNIGLTGVSVPITTVSTGSTNGALTVSGGVGISGALNIGTAATINGFPVTTMVGVPTSSTSTGVAGQIAADSTCTYICYATNTWRRIVHSTF